MGLRQFGAFNRIRLDPAPQLKELLTLAAEDEPGLLEAGLEVESVVDVRLSCPIFTLVFMLVCPWRLIVFF